VVGRDEDFFCHGVGQSPGCLALQRKKQGQQSNRRRTCPIGLIPDYTPVGTACQENQESLLSKEACLASSRFCFAAGRFVRGLLLQAQRLRLLGVRAILRHHLGFDAQQDIVELLLSGGSRVARARQRILRAPQRFEFALHGGADGDWVTQIS
jgi:hypothetical protein